MDLRPLINPTDEIPGFCKILNRLNNLFVHGQGCVVFLSEKIYMMHTELRCALQSLYFEKCCFVTKIEIRLLNMGASFEIRHWTFYFSSTFQTVSWHILHLYQNSYNWICLFITRLHDVSEKFRQEHYTNIKMTCLVLHICIHFKINFQNIHMSHFTYACKMRCPLNLVLESWEYLWFYLTFWIAILDCGLKLHKLSIHTLIMLQKWLEIY